MLYDMITIEGFKKKECFFNNSKLLGDIWTFVRTSGTGQYLSSYIWLDFLFTQHKGYLSRTAGIYLSQYWGQWGNYPYRKASISEKRVPRKAKFCENLIYQFKTTNKLFNIKLTKFKGYFQKQAYPVSKLYK